jgi:hypothetical protein
MQSFAKPNILLSSDSDKLLVSPTTLQKNLHFWQDIVLFFLRRPEIFAVRRAKLVKKRCIRGKSGRRAFRAAFEKPGHLRDRNRRAQKYFDLAREFCNK